MKKKPIWHALNVGISIYNLKQHPCLCAMFKKKRTNCEITKFLTTLKIYKFGGLRGRLDRLVRVLPLNK